MLMKERGSFFIACILGASWSGPAAAAPWSPPLGIPAPSFGITQVAPAAPSPWTTATAGFYYVDEAAAGATDTSNPYGTPAKPRRTIPASLPAGAVVEVHGTYTRSHSSPNDIVASGTSGQPVFIRGFMGTSVTKGWEIKGSYLVVENIKFDASTGGGGWTVLDPADHIVARDNEVEGTLAADGGFAVQVWGSGNVSDIVLLRNNIHHTGDWQTTYDQDGHGTGLYRSSGASGTISNVWILDSQYSYNSGDGVQINGNTGGTGKIHHVYVGRNSSHHNKQTGFWTKNASDVVFAENTTHSHRPSDSSNGGGMGFQYDPDRVWFLFNESYDNVDGIVHGSADTGSRTGAYFIGNLLHDNLNSGIQLNDWVDEEYVIGNTFYRNPIGLENGYYRVSVEISDNIFSQSSTAHISFGDGYDSGAVSNLRNSLFDAPVRIVWDDVTYTVAGIQAIGEGQGCLSGDPLFVNAAGGDFNLQFGSPAIDNGAAEAVYTTFQTLYGIDIRKDKAGRNRPQGASWDIGAYELTDVFPDVSVADAAGMEGGVGSRRLDFAVTLSQASLHVVSVDYSTVDAGATAGSDYRQLSGPLLFQPGSTTQTVGVEVLGDDVYEQDEQLILRLTNVVGGTLLRSEGVGRIVNDDAPGLTVSDGYAVERPGARARFVVTLAPPQAAPVTVGFATSDGTAVAGVDYAYSSALLTFPPNVTEQVIDVPVYADSLVERVETFTVALSGASGSPIVWAQATGRIFDPGSFFTVQPCRVIDTRGPTGPHGGPALSANQQRTFSLTGRCGIASTATTVAMNVTVTEESAAGHLRLSPAGTPLPATSTVNYSAGRTIANNAIVSLGAAGGLTVYCAQAAGLAHLVVDVVGYFE